MRQVAREQANGEAAAAFAANRAVGSVQLSAGLVEGVTRRRSVDESGSLRVRFPSPETDALSAVLINTAGGVAGGDRFAFDLRAEAGAKLVVTTAAAEKVYRTHGPAAELDVSLRAAAGARIVWLPQETILFDHASLARRIDIDLDAAASLLCAEIVVFGRTAMAERLCTGRYVDRWRLRRAGRLVFADSVHLDGAIAEKLERRAIAKGGVAIATVLIAPGDDALVGRVRESSENFHSEFGISAWNGFALARFCSDDAARLRGDVMALLKIVDAAILPRLWLN